MFLSDWLQVLVKRRPGISKKLKQCLKTHNRQLQLDSQLESTAPREVAEEPVPGPSDLVRGEQPGVSGEGQSAGGQMEEMVSHV